MTPEMIMNLAAEDMLDADEIAHLLLLAADDNLTPRKEFDLDEISDADCLSFFRFNRETILVLAQEFRIPEEVKTPTRIKFTAVEGLCVLLRRLAYPNRYSDIKHLFHRSETAIGIIFNWMLDFVYENFGYLLSSLELCWLNRENLDAFAAAIHAHGAPLQNCIGFIDGTERPCARPSEGQKVLFNGHYRFHSIAFQSVVTPNGLIMNLDGPWPGRRHDAGILLESGLLLKLREKFQQTGGNFALYGDPAYPISDVLESPFRMHGGGFTEAELQFNQDMSSARVAVEWVFGKIVNLWAFVDFTKNLKVLLQPIGKYYLVAAILTNCHSTVYGSQTESTFNVKPPSLKQYLRNTMAEE